MSLDSTFEDVLRDIPRFRILCVGRTRVGKSSLVNCIFGIKEAYDVGEASIDQEFVADENKYFVLHDSKGFEAGDDINFDIAARFLEKRRKEKLLKDRLHAIWLTIETPRAGGRVLEEGDKKLLELAHNLEIPVVVVFTKYDLLVRSKEKILKKKSDRLDEETLQAMSQAHASNAFATCVQSLDESMGLRNIPTPLYTHISIPPGQKSRTSNLVDLTRRVVQDRLKDDAWVTWAIAQRASVPVKVQACIEKGVNFYYHALSGSIPGAGDMLLWQCLARVHQNIVTCWNFKDVDKTLDGTEFQQLMLYLVQDLYQTGSPATRAPALDKIIHFVNLVTASTIHLAPPVAVLGLSYFFVKWISDAITQRIPKVECLLMAYSVDLISVLRALFNFTLKPDLAGMANWEVLRAAFEDNKTLSQENFRQKMDELLDE